MPGLNAQGLQELVLAFLAESGDEYTSGEALSGKLGLTKAQVFNSVEALRVQGYRIETVPMRGYRLVRMPDRLSALELSPLLSTHDLGRSVTYEASLPSTNVEAHRLAQEGAEHGHVVIAEAQTQGKGRRGRTWASPAGLNFYGSIILRPELPVTRAAELTLVAAVALTECLREAGVQAAIKWPNDVLVNEKKIAGVLTELVLEGDRVGFVVLGVGINLNARREDFQPDVAELATSLREARGEEVARAPFVAQFLTRLEEWLDLHEEVGFAPIRTAWKELSGTLGQDVGIVSEGSEVQGRAEDIDESGALLIRTARGTLERVVVGDVVRLRTAAR